MMRMTTMLCAGAALALSLIARPAAANTEIRIATLAPAGSPWMAVLDKAAAEKIREANA